MASAPNAAQLLCDKCARAPDCLAFCRRNLLDVESAAVFWVDSVHETALKTVTVDLFPTHLLTSQEDLNWFVD